MKMEKVKILLSTYNGERFLGEQIESLISQENVLIDILIRDDGSSDNTINILDKYQKRGKIKYYNGKNLKPARSFVDLVKNSDNCDWYAFCDQDDVWDHDKLYKAVEKLSALDKNQPIVYYSNLRIVDKNLKFYRFAKSNYRMPDNKYSCFVENEATGCTMVFNKAAAIYIKNYEIPYLSMHDSWMYMIGRIFGIVIYDDRATINYRQHEGNVIGASLKTNIFSKIKGQLGRYFISKEEPRYKNVVSFYNCYYNCLSEHDKKVLSVFLNYKNNLCSRFRLIFDKNFRTGRFINDFKFMLLVLKGIV